MSGDLDRSLAEHREWTTADIVNGYVSPAVTRAHDVEQLRGMIVALEQENAQLRGALDELLIIARNGAAKPIRLLAIHRAERALQGGEA